MFIDSTRSARFALRTTQLTLEERGYVFYSVSKCETSHVDHPYFSWSALGCMNKNLKEISFYDQESVFVRIRRGQSEEQVGEERSLAWIPRPFLRSSEGKAEVGHNRKVRAHLSASVAQPRLLRGPRSAFLHSWLFQSNLGGVPVIARPDLRENHENQHAHPCGAGQFFLCSWPCTLS